MKYTEKTTFPAAPLEYAEIWLPDTKPMILAKDGMVATTDTTNGLGFVLVTGVPKEREPITFL